MIFYLCTPNRKRGTDKYSAKIMKGVENKGVQASFSFKKRKFFYLKKIRYGQQVAGYQKW